MPGRERSDSAVDARRIQAHSGRCSDPHRRAAAPHFFWYLVAAESALAALGSILGRTTGYFDALLADRFTRYVSVRVMEHASRLDLASYEDPVFYDKLERARVQATDRISMVQAMGSVAQQVIISGDAVSWDCVVLAVAARIAGGRGCARVPGGEPLCVSRLLAQSGSDAHAPPA